MSVLHRGRDFRRDDDATDKQKALLLRLMAYVLRVLDEEERVFAELEGVDQWIGYLTKRQATNIIKRALEAEERESVRDGADFPIIDP